MNGISGTYGSFPLSSGVSRPVQREAAQTTSTMSAPSATPTTFSKPAEQTKPGAQETPSLTTPEEHELTLWEMMKEAKEKAEARRKQFQLPKNSRYGDAAMEAYSRLARARSVADVNTASGYARRKIQQLKVAKRQDSDHARQIQAVINQLTKALTRASKKKSDLRREHLSELRAKKLAKEEENRKAQRLRNQLKRAKSLRKIRESGYLREAEIDNRLQAQITKTEIELREQAQELAEAYAPSADAAIQQYTAQIPAESSTPAPELSVQA